MISDTVVLLSCQREGWRRKGVEDFLLLVLHHCKSKAVEHEVQPCSQQGERLTERKL